MKQPSEIAAAFNKLSKAAKYASKTGDTESYEVLDNCAMALGWVLETNDGTHDDPFNELLKGAEWAASGGTERN